jgi:hypothetical protein
MSMLQPTIDDLLAPVRSADPVTSVLAAVSVDVRGKQRLTLLALRELRRHNAAPVEAWRVHRAAQRIQHRERPSARPLGESTIRTRLNELCRSGFVMVVDRDGLTEANGRCGRYGLTAMGVSEAKELDHGEA